MKLSDFLFNIGRPVAFYPGLVKALGSMKQAVFICQMAYWKDKGDDPEGWIYKTSEEIESETSLTYKEQIKVRDRLVKINALEERYARTEHKMYFRVNWDVINKIWDGHLTNGHMPKSQMPDDRKSDGSLPKGSSLNSNTYTTHENTALLTPQQTRDLELFTETFGKFYGQKEIERWFALIEKNGLSKIKEIIEWASKKEIDLANRASLLDSLETAAERWSGHKSSRKTRKAPPTKQLSQEQLSQLQKQAEKDFAPWIMQSA